MNLPNKLTVLRVLMIPFFVVFMITPLAEGNGKYIRTCTVLYCKPDRYAGWKDCQKA